MSTRVISIDLWGTIFEFGTEMSVSVRRRQLVRQYAAEQGIADAELVDRAYVRASDYFYERYQSEASTLTPRDRLSYQLRLIGLNADGESFEELVGDVQTALLDNPPPLAPNLRVGLSALSEDFTLVVVSDTAFSPGKVLRRILGSYEIAHYFADYSFSDENGTAKPHPYAFTSVLERVRAAPSEFLHIGDTEWSDIKGARRLGGRTCLYVGLNDRWLNETEADFVLHDWADVPELIHRIKGSDSGVA